VDAMLDWWNALSGALRGAIDESGTVGEINARLREVLSEVQMDTLPNGRIKLLAVFANRGEWIPKTDENWNPLPDAEPDFYPDQVDMFVPPGLKLGPPPAHPVNTGGDSQGYRLMNPNRPQFAASQPYADGGPRSSSVPSRCSERPGGATHFGSGWRA
jgi:hypothetical protein